MRPTIVTLILVASLSVLGGCGQTGQLYLPEEGPPEAQPKVTTQPAETPLP